MSDSHTISYRPSNGAEGEDFQERFCFHCAHYDDDAGCPILNATWIYDQTDERYPAQWVQDYHHKTEAVSNPRCTEFRKETKSLNAREALRDAMRYLEPEFGERGESCGSAVPLIKWREWKKIVYGEVSK